MNILVTGGGGFVGSYVVERLLQRGYSVRSLGRSPQPQLAAKGIEVVCGDLTDAAVVTAACEGVDAVFHVAARAGVWGSWESYYGPNVIGSGSLKGGNRGLARTRAYATKNQGAQPQSDGASEPARAFGRHQLQTRATTRAKFGALTQTRAAVWASVRRRIGDGRSGHI